MVLMSQKSKVAEGRNPPPVEMKRNKISVEGVSGQGK